MGFYFFGGIGGKLQLEIDWNQNEEEVLTSINGNRVASLIPSSDGPKLLIDMEEYSLKETCWDVEMFHGRNSSMLIFYWKGEVKLSVKFAPLSNLYELHSFGTNGSGLNEKNKGFGWSHVEAFLMKLYQCLTFKSRTVQAI
jgi:hypothetical protein